VSVCRATIYVRAATQEYGNKGSICKLGKNDYYSSCLHICFLLFCSSRVSVATKAARKISFGKQSNKPDTPFNTE